MFKWIERHRSRPGSIEELCRLTDFYFVTAVSPYYQRDKLVYVCNNLGMQLDERPILILEDGVLAADETVMAIKQHCHQVEQIQKIRLESRLDFNGVVKMAREFLEGKPDHVPMIVSLAPVIEDLLKNQHWLRKADLSHGSVVRTHSFSRTSVQIA